MAIHMAQTAEITTLKITIQAIIHKIRLHTALSSTPTHILPELIMKIQLHILQRNITAISILKAHPSRI